MNNIRLVLAGMYNQEFNIAYSDIISSERYYSNTLLVIKDHLNNNEYRLLVAISFDGFKSLVKDIKLIKRG